MCTLKPFLIVFALVFTIALGGCLGTPCSPVVVDPNTDDKCPVGGTKCFVEGQWCSGTWPFNDNCTTVYLLGGSCACRCQ